VENLLMFGENPVDRSTSKYFSRSGLEKIGRCSIVHAPSCLPSLVCDAATTENAQASPKHRRHSKLVTNAIHRFEQSIAGRLYQIEVAPVTQDRWRAYIVRIPGVPTALMPFYGRTPDEAAGLLTEWLSRAYQRAATPATG
jgi:hypothetical protein